MPTSGSPTKLQNHKKAKGQQGHGKTLAKQIEFQNAKAQSRQISWHRVAELGRTGRAPAPA